MLTVGGAACGVHAERQIRRARPGARLGRGHACTVDRAVGDAAFAMQGEAHGSAAVTREANRHVAR